MPEKASDVSTELEVGIATFLAEKSESGDFITLNASFKHRFSDFIVNELDKETGEVVWYSSENANLQMWKMANFDNTCPGAAPHEPPKEEEVPVVEEKKEEPDENAHNGIDLEQDVLDEIKAMFFPADYERFIEFMDKLRSGQEEKSALLCFRENYSDKDLRARIHMYFKTTVKLYETDT